VNALADDQMVQNFVDAGDTTRQVANVLVGVSLQDAFEAHAVGNSANDK
jgi:hypothetical protein